jgi:hypothetical protein
MEYDLIIVESFKSKTSGRHGEIHIRPLPNQAPYTENMFVQCSKVLSTEYPVGTKFILRAKIVNPITRKAFISSHYTWPYEVLE